MKTAVIAIGVALFCLSTQAALAKQMKSKSEQIVTPINQPPVANAGADQTVQMSVKDYLGMVQKHGYRPTLNRKSGDHAVILLEKVGKTEKGHGLLSIPWEKRETWKLDYYRKDDTLVLIEKDGKVEKRAPWLGKWRAYEPTTRALALPPELQVPGLKAAFHVGVKG